ncbi:hypothetical protein Syun_018933 [Stephania yunnanensis]|uniref:Uncharacterized protein n=1 Tax=Stephania yunnanensis TaxID=152371 RepID=A0AAP0NYW6_9MAGN
MVRPSGDGRTGRLPGSLGWDKNEGRCDHGTTTFVPLLAYWWRQPGGTPPYWAATGQGKLPVVVTVRPSSVALVVARLINSKNH